MGTDVGAAVSGGTVRVSAVGVATSGGAATASTVAVASTGTAFSGGSCSVWSFCLPESRNSTTTPINIRVTRASAMPSTRPVPDFFFFFR